ncbi:N-acetylglucosamine kinase [Lentibacillus salinarum]|uniref:N-acetylglucosamine kinase n=1 Tax=Lentibacillus salinarum TaxID=446820 RepID=A0ABW3ZWB9_9BACI
MSYVIGIDGGGTKTKAVIADMNGKVIAANSTGSTNPNIVSKQKLRHTLEALFNSLEKSSNIPMKYIQFVFAGVSGAGNETNKTTLRDIMASCLPDGIPIRIEADTVNALYSGTYGDPGIVQISGTGSITYGVNRHLKHERAGGWGYLFGDEGSGYDIGRQGIIHALKSVDGRGPETVLLPMIYSHFEVTNAQSLIQKIYTASVPKNKISPITEIVFDAYKREDPSAKMILQQAAEEMCLSIGTLYEKLFEPGEKTEVVLCGGVFNETSILPKLIKTELQTYTAINVMLPKMPPVGGSIIGAYLMQDRAFDNTVINTIIKTI